MTKFFSAPQEVQTTELVRTSQRWGGIELPERNLVGTIIL